MNMQKPLLSRLDASDNELCKEAAAYIRKLIKGHNDELREAERDARDAYSQGNYDGREESSGNGGW
jgi:hypothetical protein